MTRKGSYAQRLHQRRPGVEPQRRRSADPALSHKLATNYLPHPDRTLGSTQRPLCFTPRASSWLPQEALARKNLKSHSPSAYQMIACRTCLDYYGLLDKVVVGEVGNMMRIVEVRSIGGQGDYAVTMTLKQEPSRE